MIEFMRGIRPTSYDLHPGAGKDRIEAIVEGPVPVMQHELDPRASLVEVHHQIPGLLDDPVSTRMCGGAEDSDAAGGMLDRRQDIGLTAV